MDALYFRVSCDRQTIENQFEDLLQAAEKGSADGRDWKQIRHALSNCVYEDRGTEGAGPNSGRYRLRPEIAAELARQCIYVEQGKSSKAGRWRPMFEKMKRDAAARRFDRLLVWKVSRLGRDMRQLITTVYELADLGVTVIPIKSQAGPINSSMGKLLWAVQAWLAEMENDERSDAIKAGQARARAGGKHMGRPRRIFDRQEVIRLRDEEHLSWPAISRRTGAGVGTVVRAYRNSRIGL